MRLLFCLRNLLDLLELTIYAPASPEAEDDDIYEGANDASEEINKDVANSSVTTDDRELVHLIDGAIGYTKHDGINDEGEVWIFGCVKAFDEARN